MKTLPQEAQTNQSGGPSPSPAAAMGITGPGSLKAHAGAKGLLFGTAVEAQLLSSNVDVAQIVIDQCSILVAENSMKMGPMRPTPTTYSFEAGDALVAFGDAHGIKVRGHNLNWHAQLPTAERLSSHQDNARQLLVDHITTVAGRARASFYSLGLWTNDRSSTDRKTGRAAQWAMVEAAGAGVHPARLQDSARGRSRRAADLQRLRD